jgi:NifU-like protein
MKFEELNFEEKKSKIEEIINKNIRPALAMDGGSLEVLDILEDDEGIKIIIKYLGACQGCASSGSTLFAIENELVNQLDYEKIRVIDNTPPAFF